MAVADSMVAESVAVITGGTICPPDPDALDDLPEAHECDLRRINHAENGFHSLFSKARDRDCRVAQFGTPQRPRRALAEQDHGKFFMSSSRLWRSVLCSAGATNPPPLKEIATPTWISGFWHGLSPAPNRVQLRESRAVPEPPP